MSRGASLGFVSVDLDELERRAATIVDPSAWDYFAGGADDEVTLAGNLAGWRALRLAPKVLRDVSAVDASTTVLGTPVSLPVLVAPTAYQRMAHDEGECATARAAAAAGTVMVASTLATTALEQVAAAAPGAPRWFQLYVHRDRGFTAELVARAVDSGYTAIVLTVDAPILGFRRRDERNNFTLPPHLQMANMSVAVPTVEGSGIAAYAATALDPGVTFADLAWLRSLSVLPLVAKGVQRGDDAARCSAEGVDAIAVSNHGGRQLDTARPTAEVLPEVVAAVDCEVLVDGGIRRGTDVVKALALGARAVLIGRPVLWGLATGGESGVLGVLDGFREAVLRAMVLCGAATVDELTADLVVT